MYHDLAGHAYFIIACPPAVYRIWSCSSGEKGKDHLRKQHIWLDSNCPSQAAVDHGNQHIHKQQQNGSCYLWCTQSTVSTSCNHATGQVFGFIMTLCILSCKIALLLNLNYKHQLAIATQCHISTMQLAIATQCHKSTS